MEHTFPDADLEDYDALSTSRASLPGLSRSASKFEYAPTFSRSTVRRKYEFLEEIGRGKFGVVVRARNRETGDIVAIKKVRMKWREVENIVRNEVAILSQIQHPNVVRLIETFEIDTLLRKKMYIVMEMVEGGELYRHLRTVSSLGEDKARSIMRQLFEVLDHLHAHGITHRDLKPENILLQRPNDVDHIKLADFGISSQNPDRMKGIRHVMTTRCGSRPFLAPEMFAFDRKYGPEIDMWACGVIGFVLLSGSLPFVSEDELTLYQKIIGGVYDIESGAWAQVSSDAKSLIREILVTDPEKRLTAKAALKHRWFHNKNPGRVFPNFLHQYTSEMAGMVDPMEHWRQLTVTVTAVQRLQRLAHMMSPAFESTGRKSKGHGSHDDSEPRLSGRSSRSEASKAELSSKVARSNRSEPRSRGGSEEKIEEPVRVQRSKSAGTDLSREKAAS